MLIKEYDLSWKDDFNALKSALERALKDLKISIEHVGSTAVEGLAAKPIIDIDIVYESEAEFKTIKSRLENAGYYHNGDQGIAGREVFKRRISMLKNTVSSKIKHHLYVCHSGSTELNRHLVFRDVLRNNETARNQYQALKYQIATEANQDQKVYAKLKEENAKGFIESVSKNNY